MDFSNSVLDNMNVKKLNYNKQYGNWYWALSEETKETELAYSKKLKSRSERLHNCLNLWSWNVYRKNKLMDLQKVNRCMNSRFCPNCRRMDLAKCIQNLRKPFNKLLLEGYNPYLLTCTIPNCTGAELGKEIDKLNQAFKKLFIALSYPVVDKVKGYRNRLMEFQAALRVLEITKNKETGMWHPHIHILMWSDEYDPSLFLKELPGDWSSKRGNYNFHSAIDIEIMKLFTMYYKGVRVSVDNYNKFNLKDCFLCDIREMNDNGLYECLKYVFKDTDVCDFSSFKTLVKVLENRKIRQAYGLLHSVTVEGEVEDGEVIPLAEYLTEIEEPESLVTNCISQLTTDFKEYRKISRKKSESA